MEFGYKYVGQFQNQEEINNWAVQDGAGNTTLMPGDLKFEDFNGDGVINEYDLQPIGRSNTPEIYFDWISASWKGFDLYPDARGHQLQHTYGRDHGICPVQRFKCLGMFYGQMAPCRPL